MPRVSVIVVSYNTREHLRACLDSIEEHHEVIVVDNASRDGSAEMVSSEYPNTRLIANDRNLGFGTANNQAFGEMSGTYALLINSDCVTATGAIDSLADFLDQNSDYVACGGQLVGCNGGLQQSSANRLTVWAVFCEQSLLEKAFPSSALFSPYWNSARLDSKHPSRTWQVMGACLMMRPIERFDERFFLYCEDTELCHRLHSHGLIAYVPTARFKHALGASSSGLARWKSVARYNRGKELYFAIHHGKLTSSFVWLLNRCGALLRLIIWSVASLLSLFLVRRIRTQPLLWMKVLAAPISGPDHPADTAR